VIRRLLTIADDAAGAAADRSVDSEVKS